MSGYQDGDDLMWVFIITVFCALFMAFGMGANDVANAFATSVGSKSLTLKQAVVIASVFEMSGALLMGGFVSKNIQKKIADTKCFDNDPALMMIGMCAALLGTGSWLIIATFFALPVSTSHGIIGGIIGAVMVTHGWGCINQMGLLNIVLSWLTSPLFAAFCGMCIFGTIKWVILRAKEPVRRGLRVFPLFVFFTAFVLSFFALYKGTPILRFYPFTWWQVFLICIAISTVFLVLSYALFVPLLRRKIRRTEAHNKFTEGIELSKPQVVIMPPEGSSDDAPIVNATAGMGAPGRPAKSSSRAKEAAPPASSSSGSAGIAAIPGAITKIPSVLSKKGKTGSNMRYRSLSNLEKGGAAAGEVPKPDGPREDSTPSQTSKPESPTQAAGMSWMERMYLQVLKPKEGVIIEGDVNLETEQSTKEPEPGAGATGDSASGDEDDGDKRTKPGKNDREKKQDLAEVMFSRLLVVSAMLTSFAHGANDVANSIGPLAAVWTVYQTNKPPSSGNTPWWMLLIGGLGIVIGLLVWGSRVIKTMGERLTKMTYSKGFSIQIGAVISVISASRLGMPISSTHCQVGATVGVGLMEGKMAVRWVVFLNIVLSWIITIPAAGLLSAAITAILRECIRT